ncbi:WAS/WASL-interacting protein family member 3-like [Penaeus japonicus]|uniref:WAS/WASL-interacting protein family member 3-like n=1 Tax=Penaeus japonicus TaxID=27405 RepID=UPI001C70F65E|nr:WAS/WASL-interacting protein family member 3-like [Penaeus japonicus]
MHEQTRETRVYQGNEDTLARPDLTSHDLDTLPAKAGDLNTVGEGNATRVPRLVMLLLTLTGTALLVLNVSIFVCFANVGDTESSSFVSIQPCVAPPPTATPFPSTGNRVKVIVLQPPLPVVPQPATVSPPCVGIITCSFLPQTHHRATQPWVPDAADPSRRSSPPFSAFGRPRLPPPRPPPPPSSLITTTSDMPPTDVSRSITPVWDPRPPPTMPINSRRTAGLPGTAVALTENIQSLVPLDLLKGPRRPLPARRGGDLMTLERKRGQTRALERLLRPPRLLLTRFLTVRLRRYDPECPAKARRDRVRVPGRRRESEGVDAGQGNRPAKRSRATERRGSSWLFLPLDRRRGMKSLMTKAVGIDIDFGVLFNYCNIRGEEEK